MGCVRYCAELYDFYAAGADIGGCPLEGIYRPGASIHKRPLWNAK